MQLTPVFKSPGGTRHLFKESCTWKCFPTRCCTSKEKKTSSRDFAGRHEQKDKQGGRVSRTSGNKGSKSNWEVEEGCTAVDNTQYELIDKDDTCSMEQAATNHGPRKDANPKTYSGLLNQGSTCYLNTVLQILFMTDECRRAVMRLNEADGNPVSEELKKLFDKLNRNGQVPDTSGITQTLGITDVYRQEDASEYFKKILSKVNPDVTKIYEGKINQTVTCKKGHQLKNDSSPFTLIPLSINNPYNPSSGIISVEDAWKDHFKSTEAILYCSSCESETLAQFESKINVFPQILALHLDRLDIFSSQKNTCKVKIPSTLTDKGWTYELYAIANHYGSPRGGHYNAFIKPYGDKCWWLFDDSHVRKMEELQREHHPNSSAADLLFYKKIFLDDLKAENTLEKGNDRYPSQDHRKLPTRRKPRQQDVKENMEEQLETLCGTLKANKSAQTQEMEKFCRDLIQITKTTGPINEQLKNYKHLSVQFVDENRAELIKRVTAEKAIADALYSKKMVHCELYTHIQAERISQERMRLIYTALDSAEAKKAAFLELLIQEDRYLVQDLAKKKLRQLEACDVDVP